MNLLAAQTKLAPQPNDAITAGFESLSDEFRLQAQRPIGFMGLDGRRLDGDLQPFVVLRALRRRVIKRRVTWYNLISTSFLA